MKYNFFLLAIILGIIAIIGCSKINEKSAEELLNNPKMEEEIYSGILSNSNRFSKFIDRIMADENGKTMMVRNKYLMKTICLSENMDTLLKDDKQMMETMSNRLINNISIDSVACDQTCIRLMKNDQINRYFKEHASKL